MSEKVVIEKIYQLIPTYQRTALQNVIITRINSIVGKSYIIFTLQSVSVESALLKLQNVSLLL